MVKEATGLVEGDQQHGLLPLRAGAESIIDLLQENLAGRNLAGRVHGVGVEAAAGRIDVGELGECSQESILEEVLEGHDVGLGVGGSPFEEHGVRKESAVGAIVVLPGDVLAGGHLKDAGDWDGGDVEVIVILAVAIRGTSDSAETVRVGRLDGKSKSGQLIGGFMVRDSACKVDDLRPGHKSASS